MRSEKISWQANLDQAVKEATFYKSNCDDLKQEIIGLQRQRDNLYSQHIAGLEKQVRDMSKHDNNNVETPFKKTNVDAQVQTSEEKESETVYDEHYFEKMTRDGLLRLEENRAMLMRTGVYTIDDPIIIKLDEQIRKMRKKIGAEKEN